MGMTQLAMGISISKTSIGCSLKTGGESQANLNTAKRNHKSQRRNRKIPGSQETGSTEETKNVTSTSLLFCF
jgi:hypothetical protein